MLNVFDEDEHHFITKVRFEVVSFSQKALESWVKFRFFFEQIKLVDTKSRKKKYYISMNLSLLYQKSINLTFIHMLGIREMCTLCYFNREIALRKINLLDWHV